MKVLLFLGLLFISIESFSQSINILDEKYGFKDLKFETLKSDIKDKIFDCSEDGHCILIGDIYDNIRCTPSRDSRKTRLL